MCGITGVAVRDGEGSIDRDMLLRMTDRLAHRGPDARFLLVQPGIGLGVQRLSIIDIEGGDQPLSNEDETIQVICNGEIYNYVELRAALQRDGHRFRTDSDIEVVAHLYEDLGVECVHHLRGMFALAIWDAGERTLFLARDRFGIKPLYYAESETGLYFASEQKALLEACLGDRAISFAGLEDILTLGFVVAPHTMFEGISQLEPGSFLRYHHGRKTIRRYWDLCFPERMAYDRARSEETWAGLLLEKLEETVRIHLRSDVPVGAWLSAGLDSSSIIALSYRILGRPLRTTMLGFDDPALDETRGRLTLLDVPQIELENRFAVCGRGDLERLVQAVWTFEDPCISGLEIPRLLLGESSAKDVKVVVTGEGADELFGGYTRFRLDRWLRPLARLPRWMRSSILLLPHLSDRYRRASSMLVAPHDMTLTRYAHTLVRPRAQIIRSCLTPGLRAEMPDDHEPSWDLVQPAGFARWHPFCQLQYYEMHTRLPSWVLHHVDRGAMAYSVEARVPFLDHEFAEFASAIPPSLKLRRTREKHILREAVRPLLPPAIVNRPKKGLNAPLAHWYREPLPAFAEAMLSPDALRRKGYFVPACVPRLLAEHRSAQIDRSYELSMILGVQLWDEVFLQDAGPCG